ncbi:MAG: ribbon-helix-helix protein, CopG family [Acidobacteria bacterium]|nr:ribbon-helix-helix protein, CopG family [Acidobacteriota bacterium]MXZ71965.1 ribbon-helix-helix protein, CopG family [Acidobacteriota bacterium]MYD69316.1 ribbon-helix-helix protein, CopG family [Acidobacteriota bacterium]MYJ04773.1 ribbon-helix-helix protein, CopG family [Acidobacteriota bacterium]
MVRIQIRLPEELARALKEQARLEARPMADLVRECVADYMARGSLSDRAELAGRARGLAGRFRSRCPDLAEEHDRYLEEVFDS